METFDISPLARAKKRFVMMRNVTSFFAFMILAMVLADIGMAVFQGQQFYSGIVSFLTIAEFVVALTLLWAGLWAKSHLRLASTVAAAATSVLSLVWLMMMVAACKGPEESQMDVFFNHPYCLVPLIVPFGIILIQVNGIRAANKISAETRADEFLFGARERIPLAKMLRYSNFKSIAYLLAAFVTALLVVAFTALISEMIVNHRPDDHSTGSAKGLMLLVVLCVVPYALAVKSYRVLLARASYDLSKPISSPVVLLRSFDDDSIFIKPTNTFPALWNAVIYDHPLGRHTLATLTLENILDYCVPGSHAFIAVGEPGETLPKTGAFRHYLDNKSWRAGVDVMLRMAKLNLVIVGKTDNLRWEILRIKGSNRLAETIFVFPPDDRAGLALRAERLGADLGVSIPIPTCAAGKKGIAALLVIDRDKIGHVFFADGHRQHHYESCMYRAVEFVRRNEEFSRDPDLMDRYLYHFTDGYHYTAVLHDCLMAIVGPDSIEHSFEQNAGELLIGFMDVFRGSIGDELVSKLTAYRNANDSDDERTLTLTVSEVLSRAVMTVQEQDRNIVRFLDVVTVMRDAKCFAERRVFPDRDTFDSLQAWLRAHEVSESETIDETTISASERFLRSTRRAWRDGALDWFHFSFRFNAERLTFEEFNSFLMGKWGESLEDFLALFSAQTGEYAVAFGAPNLLLTDQRLIFLLEGEADQIEVMIVRLSSLLRYSISGWASPEVSLFYKDGSIQVVSGVMNALRPAVVQACIEERHWSVQLMWMHVSSNALAGAKMFFAGLSIPIGGVLLIPFTLGLFGILHGGEFGILEYLAIVSWYPLIGLGAGAVFGLARPFWRFKALRIVIASISGAAGVLVGSPLLWFFIRSFDSVEMSIGGSFLVSAGVGALLGAGIGVIALFDDLVWKMMRSGVEVGR